MRLFVGTRDTPPALSPEGDSLWKNPSTGIAKRPVTQGGCGLYRRWTPCGFLRVLHTPRENVVEERHEVRLGQPDEPVGNAGDDAGREPPRRDRNGRKFDKGMVDLPTAELRTVISGHGGATDAQAKSGTSSDRARAR